MNNRRWILALTISALFLGSIGQSQNTTTKVSDPVARRALRPLESPSQMICSISSFFSFDANDTSGTQLVIEGRGLATCQNDQGFTTEIPVFGTFTAEAKEPLATSGELSFSANSSAFVIPRETNQIQDHYQIRTFASNYTDRYAPTLLFRGARNDLVIEMKLSTSTQAFQKVELKTLTLKFDEQAPSLD